MPGYTHLQRAQPVYLSHHLLAYFWMFRRDARRFEFVLGSTCELPLGAGALAGVNFETDRDLRRRASSASPAWRANSIDAVSNRDFVLDFLPPRRRARRTSPGSARRSSCGRRRSSASPRCPTPGRPARRSCRRRRTPTRRSCCARRRRASRRGSSRSTASCTGCRYLQQGHAGGQGAPVRRRRHARRSASPPRPGCSRASRFDRERLAAAAADELIAATDIADLLVRRGVPFRAVARDRRRARARGASTRGARCPT